MQDEVTVTTHHPHHYHSWTFALHHKISSTDFSVSQGWPKTQVRRVSPNFKLTQWEPSEKCSKNAILRILFSVLVNQWKSLKKINWKISLNTCNLSDNGNIMCTKYACSIMQLSFRYVIQFPTVVPLQWDNINSMSSLCSAALFIFYLIILRIYIECNLEYNIKYNIL